MNLVMNFEFGVQRSDRNLIEGVVDPAPTFRAADEPGLAQHPKVMRQQRWRYLGQLRQRARTLRSALKLAHNRPPHRITQRTKLFNND